MLDADGIELDVHSTRDGGIVVHHDPDIPGIGPIGGLSLSEARQLKIPNGEQLPLLSEILELVGNRDVWVEVKSLPALHDQKLLEVLDRGPVPIGMPSTASITGSCIGWERPGPRSAGESC